MESLSLQSLNSTSLVFPCKGPLPLEDRQIMRRHGQDDDGDAGLVDGSNAAAFDARPAAVAALLRHEMLDHARVPVFPVLATDLVHGVGGIIMAIIKVGALVEVLLEVLDGLG